jgi:acyl-CoA dehydrogenase
MFATQSQREQWLNPLLNGEIRSCFAMTEPDVASSDATNITTSIKRDQDDYVINGRKWYISGAGNPACKVAILMGKTDFNAPTHQQQSMVIVPLDTPGLTIVRDMSVLSHHSRETHCEIVFDNVRVPASNLLGEEGAGFALAQARLGPGRIHHCMRSIGQAKLALDLMAERAMVRSPFGKPLHEQGVVQEMMARSAIEIEQARLLVLKAAWLIDQGGAKAARNEIAMIKVSVPQVTQTVIDRAIQVFGAMGLSQDVPLSEMLGTARALRLADGPDEVHLRSIAKGVIKHTKDNLGQAQRFLTQPDRGQETDIRNS